MKTAAKVKDERIDIPVDLFKCGVVVWIGDRERMRTHLAKEGLHIDDVDFRSIGDAVGAVLDVDGEPDKVIWLEELDIPVAVHEAIHAAKRMLGEKGVDDEETLCYLAEHIVRVICASRCGSRSLSSSDGTSRRTGRQSSQSSRRARS